MRVAIVSDIHGNLTALEAVLADLRETSPDVVLHGGDLAHSGSSPVEVVDRIRELGWAGVLGNTDEMLFRPESLEEFAAQSSAPAAFFAAIREMAAWTREMLGEERLSWLKGLPLAQKQGPMALVHATPESLWRSVLPEAADTELESTFEPLERGVAVYAHIHRSYVREVGEMTVANTGSVSLSHDGDVRASYLLVEGRQVTMRRVEYDLEREVRALAASGLPRADWVSRGLRAARPQTP